MISQLEPFGIFTLASGLLYSIGVLTLQSNHCRLHFLVLTMIIFIALMSIVTFKYFKYRLTCERIDHVIASMKKIQ